MKWLDDHTQDILLEKDYWYEFSSKFEGSLKTIQTADHVYNRLELHLKRTDYQIIFQESDVQNWTATTSGRSDLIEPFSVSPHDLLDNLTSLFDSNRSSLKNPKLYSEYSILGASSDQLLAILSHPQILLHLGEFNRFQLSAYQNESGFVIKFIPDPNNTFKQAAHHALGFLDILVPRLFESGLISRKNSMGPKP